MKWIKKNIFHLINILAIILSFAGMTVWIWIGFIGFKILFTGLMLLLLDFCLNDYILKDMK